MPHLYTCTCIPVLYDLGKGTVLCQLRQGRLHLYTCTCIPVLYDLGEGTVLGQLRQGRLHGKVSIQDFADNSRTELIYRLKSYFSVTSYIP